MLTYKIASQDDLPLLMRSRLEMLRVVNGMADDDSFAPELVHSSEEYFKNGRQTTVLALADNNTPVGCATICYIEIMPTFSHPTGKRAHLMNVYTNNEYRRQGIARKMVEMLIAEARSRGVTEISLDATASGRPLYEALGFTRSDECMTLCL